MHVYIRDDYHIVYAIVHMLIMRILTLYAYDMQSYTPYFGCLCLKWYTYCVYTHAEKWEYWTKF
jgi:hypothetical protein